MLEIALSLVVAPATFAQAAPPGPQFQVNSYTTNGQYSPDVAVDDEGGFIVVWQSAGSNGSDTNEASIQAQRFGAGGSPEGAQFQVNTYTTGGQFLPAVAANAAGNFVVVWSGYGSSGNDSSYTSIHGQRFDALGNPQGGEIQINTYTSFIQTVPAVDLAASGEFVVTWMSYGSSGTDTDASSVQARRFSANGEALGDQFQVNTLTTLVQSGPAVTMDDAGAFFIVWHSSASSGSDSGGIQGRRFDADGNPLGPEFQINSYTTGAQARPDVERAANGDFVVVWMNDGSGGSDSNEESVQARLVASNGVPQGEDFQVNTFTPGRQGYPKVAIRGTGEILVAWQSVGSSGSDQSDRSVQARPFAADGAALSREFQVNILTTSHQLAPVVALNESGGVFLAWSSAVSGGNDTSLSSIQAKRYDWIFTDGFESGDLDRWSFTEP